jgi:hypothetical protein
VVAEYYEDGDTTEFIKWDENGNQWLYSKEVHPADYDSDGGDVFDGRDIIERGLVTIKDGKLKLKTKKIWTRTKIE